ncbi:hypothetical protein HDV02_004604 [Globomyces sp. JEL0801]|nr:hypothetical protein HDV02_004604 [Globomyces sp. JEL0801]
MTNNNRKRLFSTRKYGSITTFQSTRIYTSERTAMEHVSFLKSNDIPINEESIPENIPEIPNISDITWSIDMDCSVSVDLITKPYTHIVYNTRNISNSFQVFVLKNTTGIDDELDEKLEEYFFFILLINIEHEHNRKLHLICSLCSEYKIPLYCKLSGIKSNGDETPSKFTDIFPCKHVYPVLSHLYYEHSLSRILSKTDPDFLQKVLYYLTTKLTDDYDLQPGFYEQSISLHRSFQHGQLALFFHYDFKAVLVAIKESTKSTPYYFCFKCPRSKACIHCSGLPSVSQVVSQSKEDDIEENNMYLSRSEPTYQTNLISVRTYPFNITLDEQLCSIIRFRNQYGFEVWYLKNKKLDGLVEKTSCCGTRVSLSQANKKKQLCSIEQISKLDSTYTMLIVKYVKKITHMMVAMMD